VLTAAAKTGRVVVADPAHQTCGVAAEISALVSEHVFDSLRAPVRRVTTPDMQIPFSPALKSSCTPTELGSPTRSARSWASPRRSAPDRLLLVHHFRERGTNTMSRVDVLLPQWGMGMSEGTITSWLKGVGDTVAEDEPLAEVEAEKVEETLESPAAGTIVEIKVPEGETVEVRTPVAVIETTD
jgi:hypothetical protein